MPAALGRPLAAEMAAADRTVRVYISADLEGIGGVVEPEHTASGNEGYERARRLMMGEVNAAVAGAFDGGAEAVVINDSHAAMTNLIPEDLDRRAELITGNCKPFSMVQGLDGSFSAVFLIGYHARAGTPGVISHTYAGTAFEVLLNGQPVGEAELSAAVAGYWGVPVALITGDSVLIEQVQETIRPIQALAVKIPQSRRAARCLHPDVVRERIRRSAADAMRDLGRGEPYVPNCPIRLEIVYRRTENAELAAVMPGAELKDPRTVAFTAPDALEMYRAFVSLMHLAGE